MQSKPQKVNIQGVPENQNGVFSVPCDLKVLYLFTSSNKVFSAKENDTKIIEFG